VFYTSFTSLPVFKFHFSFLSISLLTSLYYFLTAFNKFQKMKFYFPFLSLYIFTFNFQINYPFLFISIIILYLFLSNILSRQTKYSKLFVAYLKMSFHFICELFKYKHNTSSFIYSLFANLQQFIFIIPPFNVFLSVYLDLLYLLLPFQYIFVHL
jgi:hypothetical protein